MRLRRRRQDLVASAPGRVLAADRTVEGRQLTSEERDPAPLIACVDEPARQDDEYPGMCRVQGWAVSRDGNPIVVRARLDDQPATEHELDVTNLGVASALGGNVDHVPDRCGFDFTVDVRGAKRNGSELSLEITDGAHVLELAPYRVRLAAPGAPRADYKNVWNTVSGDVDEAKTAVAGYTDEDQFREMADVTVATLQGTVGIGPDDVVLEIGAGVGRVGPAIAPKCKRWIATDVSENMLDHARRRCAGLDNVEFVPLNGWDLSPIASESIDVVYCTVVFMHLDEWERWGYVKEAMRVLRPGGRLYFDNYTITGDQGWEFFITTAESYHPLERPANISKSSTPDEARVYMERAGFEDIVVQESPMFVWAYARKPV